MKLTSKEREQLLRAAELVASNKAFYTVASLVYAGGGTLVCKFNDFYKNSDGYLWDVDDLDDDQRQCASVLMILWFREVANEA